MIVRDFLGDWLSRSVHTWYGIDGSHLSFVGGRLCPVMTLVTGQAGEPLRDLGTCLEEGSTGQPVG